MQLSKLNKIRAAMLNKLQSIDSLNNSIATEIEKLEQIAQEKAKLITLIEEEIFSFTVGQDGSLIPKHPKYWEGHDGKVYLRLDH